MELLWLIIHFLICVPMNLSLQFGLVLLAFRFRFKIDTRNLYSSTNYQGTYSEFDLPNYFCFLDTDIRLLPFTRYYAPRCEAPQYYDRSWPSETPADRLGPCWILVNWICNGSLYNALVLVVRFELYMFWSNLNYICIYICLVEFESF